MSTRITPNEPDTDPDATDQNSSTQEQSLFLRIVHTYRRAGVWLGHRVTETWHWARQQPPRMLAQAAALGLIGIVLAYTVLRLLVALVSGLWSWVFGGDQTTTPAPPPPANNSDGPPRWLADLPQQPLWNGLGDNLIGWIQHQAVLAGIPALVLALGWAVAGALLLLAAWFRGEAVHNVAWWAWLATTCWLIWLHTPAHSPIPAAIVATAGVVISTVPVIGLLVALPAAVGVLLALS